MVCAKRIGVYAFYLGIFVCAQGNTLLAKGSKDDNRSSDNSVVTTPAPPSSAFQWHEHRKLSWEDFRGPVSAVTDESAAATHCGIGFRMSMDTLLKKPVVTVYNTFYTNKSWVKRDARLPEILDHEQGHFDLCEIYTRKLRSRISIYNFSATDIRPELMRIYDEVSNEYEARQQAYEQQTAHGTITSKQKKWQEMISYELL